jgi:NAD(P)-dependent dehydrogenase (short-subunit alcohol dehydrogenase family)
LRLSGKTALITGSGSGIGLETAKLFVREGASVVMVGRDPDKIARAAAEVGQDAIGAVADVARPDTLIPVMRQAEKRLGRIDILFANAGISETPTFIETTESAYDAIMDVNVRGAIFTVIRSLPRLSDGASIVLTGSVAARKGWPGGSDLRCHQGGRKKLCAELGCRGRHSVTQNSCQRRDPRRDSYATNAAGDRRSRHQSVCGWACAHEALGRSARSRGSSALPGIRCFLLCHGSRNHRRWRPRTCLTTDFPGLMCCTARRLPS